MTQSHIEAFNYFSHILEVDQLDVVMKIFVQCLEGEARMWFKDLPNASITTWEELENAFTHKWGEKRDHEYLLTEFNALRKGRMRILKNLSKYSRSNTITYLLT